ncbi:MAG: ribonuclease HI [Spirochaetaceae bacterium]|jgi:ribonuclease HI|nr:ribonuclease HI [Spirochaetaceae bacterium]
MRINIYTDGGCSGNPGPGGWAFVMFTEGGTTSFEKNGGEPATTNNRMELTAVIKALERLSSLGGSIDGVTVFTDSQYVQKGISEWIAGWKRNGWITSTKQPVKNADLWKKLDALAAGYPICWKWVKGHAGNPLNERCDALVQQAIHAVRTGYRV